MGLTFRVSTDLRANLIRVDFQKKVGSLGFTLREALLFQDMFQKHIDALVKGQHKGDGNGG